MNTSTPKFDLYQDITDRIIAALESGTTPWLQPWRAAGSHLGLPKNAVSNRFYSGVNIILLWLSAAENGYQQSKWITAKAAADLGGHIRKGEKATRVVSYRPVEREKCDADGNPLFDEAGNPEIERFAMLKKHYLFNIEQCEKLPAELFEPIEPAAADEKQFREFADIRTMLDGIGLTVKSEPSNRAYYHPRSDTVVMPEMKQFNSEAGYYSTLLHEMTHATGHQSRLGREAITSGKAKFGNKLYAFEELVAEMGGAFLCAHIGFNTVRIILPVGLNYSSLTKKRFSVRPAKPVKPVTICLIR